MQGSGPQETFFLVGRQSKNFGHHGWPTKFGPENDSKPHIWSLYINFRFSGRNTQNQQKLAKNITYFTTLNSLNSLQQHIQKTYSLYEFPSKHVFRLVSEKTFSLYHS